MKQIYESKLRKMIDNTRTIVTIFFHLVLHNSFVLRITKSHRYARNIVVNIRLKKPLISQIYCTMLKIMEYKMKCLCYLEILLNNFTKIFRDLSLILTMNVHEKLTKVI